MKSLILPATFAGLVFASGVSAQSWDQLVQQQWPGDMILKVTAADAKAFVLAHPGMEAGTGIDAFLRLQYAAYGHNSVGTKGEFINTGGYFPAARAAQFPRAEASVLEGPEPNGDPNDPIAPGTPTAFACGDTGLGEVMIADDDDWWSFTLTSDQNVMIWTSEGSAGQIDTILDLFDSTSTLVTSNDDGGPSTLSLIETSLTAGTYFINARAFSANTGTYGLDLVCFDAPGPGPALICNKVAEGAEPNGDPLDPITPGVPTLVDCEDVAGGNILDEPDTDWWSFTLTAATDVRLETHDDSSNGSPVVDTTLRLRDAAGLSIGFDDDGGAGLYSSLSVSGLAAGTYFVEIDGFGMFSGRIGDYCLEIDCDGAGFVLLAQEGAEPNGDPNDPTTPGTPTAGNCEDLACGDILDTLDTDWTSFTLTAASDVRLESSGFDNGNGNGEVIDTTMTLYDASFVQIDFNDDGGIGLYSLISQTALAAGTYYVEIDGFGTTGTRMGGYLLEIDCDGVPFFPAPVLASWTDLGGGCAGTNSAPVIAIRNVEVPVIGSSYSLDCSGLAPSGLIATMYGLSNAGPVPFDLAANGLGPVGCFIDVVPDAFNFEMADSNGNYEWCISIPHDPVFLSMTFYQQILSVDMPDSLVTSNSGEAVVGDSIQ